MIRRHSWVALATVLLALAMGSTDLEAQRGQRLGDRAQDRTELERRIRARFGEMVRQRLGLSEADARLLNEVVQSFQEDRSRLARQEQALRRRMEAFVLEENADEQEAVELLDRQHALRVEEAELSRTEMSRLMEVLSPAQVLRFYAMREEMGNRIRQLRGPGAPARRPGGGMLPGGAGSGGVGPFGDGPLGELPWRSDAATPGS